MEITNLSGKVFGYLKVLSRSGRLGKRGRITWLCICSCGKYKIIRGEDLKSGNTKSCGCMQSELTSERFKTHGMTATKTYRAWEDMKKRCLNKKNKRYYSHGARGITICKEWFQFKNFLDDMGVCPLNLTLERIDNNGNYEKNNCKWATYKEQARNKRNNRIIEFDGKIKCLSEWAEYVGVNPDTLGSRLNYLGWSIERTLTTPVIGK